MIKQMLQVPKQETLRRLLVAKETWLELVTIERDRQRRTLNQQRRMLYELIHQRKGRPLG